MTIKEAIKTGEITQTEMEQGLKNLTKRIDSLNSQLKGMTGFTRDTFVEQNGFRRINSAIDYHKRVLNIFAELRGVK